MAAEPEDIADPDEEPFSPSIFLSLSPTPPHPDEEPFSPSIFLNLSPTPPQPDDQDPAAAPAASSNSYHQAPQPSTDEIPCIANTIDGGVGTCFTLSPCFPDTAPVLDGVTWPYDPVELSQELLSSTTTPYPNNIGRDGGLTMGDANAASLHVQDASASVGFWRNGGKTTTTPASAGDVGEHDGLFSSGGAGETAAQNRVTMDMLNQAFLKGMEEATKFLPTNNSLLVHLEATSESGDRHDIIAAGQKRHSRDNLEVEAMAGRKSKVVAPEPEETGEMVDKVVLVEYHSLLHKMMDMSIAVDREAERKARKGKRKSGSGSGASSNKEEEKVVDLRTLLLQCAQAVATGDRLGAAELLRKIKQHSSPTGDATQRLAYCFARGLDARLAGTGSQLYRSLMVKHTSAMEFIKAYQIYLAVSCFKMMAFKFSNLTIRKAVAGRRKKLHIIDYGEHYGFHWATLLGFWGTKTWEEGPPEVRITFVGLPQPGFRPAARIEETGRRLSTFARQCCGIAFKFRCITAKWETVRAEDLDLDPDEVLVVNGLFHFGRVMDDEGIDSMYSPSPRDVLLGNIQKMRPHVFILCVENSLHNAPFFLGRFQEALFHYSSMFDMMDAAAPRDNDQRLLVEQDLFGRRVLNVVACEGFDRVERPETYKQWQVRNHRAGLRQLPLDPDIITAVSEKVRDNYHRDFFMNVDQKWLLQGWKGRILYAMSTWVANDGISDLN